MEAFQIAVLLYFKRRKMTSMIFHARYGFLVARFKLEYFLFEVSSTVATHSLLR